MFPEAGTSHTAVKRGHAGTADHHMRAGGIQERNYLLYVALRALSSGNLDDVWMLRYNARRSAPAPPNRGTEAVRRAMMSS